MKVKEKLKVAALMIAAIFVVPIGLLVLALARPKKGKR
jgi:hypothetical protein